MAMPAGPFPPSKLVGKHLGNASVKDDLIARWIRWLLGRVPLQRYFGYWQESGFHVLPVNFYSPVPDTRELHADSLRTASEMRGVSLNEEAQLELLQSFRERYASEYDALHDDPTPDRSEYYHHNGFFESVDPELLYCMIRHHQPARIIEVGSGFSTRLAAQAVSANIARSSEYACEYMVVDPFAAAGLSDLLSSGIRVFRCPVQDMDTSIFELLDHGDILFIDSTHTVRIGGDVIFEVLEILPRLKPGVLIHFHDIFLPRHYPPEIVLDNAPERFWAEQYLLQAFLAFNPRFEIVFAAAWMHQQHGGRLSGAFRSYRERCEADPIWIGPGSIWLRSVA